MTIGAALWLAACGVQGGSNELDGADLDPADTGGGGSDTTTADDTSTPPPDGIEPQGSLVGAGCAEKADCGEGGICSTLLPGGYCTLACDAAACPEGSECRSINDFPFCMASCTDASDCREGYACLDGVCDIECAADADCSVAEVCESGECVQGEATQALGETCAASSQCLTGYCATGESGTVCVEPCGSGASCSLEEWSCQNLTPVDGDVELRLCAPRPPREVDVIELPTNSDPFTFTLPDDAVSFMIVAETGDRNDTLGVFNIRNPSGTAIAGWPNNVGFTEPFRTNPGEGHGTVLVPNNSDPTLQIMPGTWSFEAAVFGEFKALSRVRVFIKRVASGQDPTTGTIDLNIYVPAGLSTGITAATAASNAEVSGALSTMREYWGAHGLTIGQVRYYDIGSGYASVGNDDELREMFESQSALGAPDALNLFLVDYLLSRGTAGIAGGIPGPHGIAGTGGSGVAVELQGSGAASGDDMTHELGHFMGFYHVSEQPQPISETQCTSSTQCPEHTQCMNFGEWGQYCALSLHDVIDDTSECTWTSWNEACMRNIMYPSLLTGHVDQSLSAEQGRIGRLSHIAR